MGYLVIWLTDFGMDQSSRGFLKKTFEVQVNLKGLVYRFLLLFNSTFQSS